MSKIELINESIHEFTNIESEEYRVYEYADGEYITSLLIENPRYLSVSESGGHRILDAEGISHYIPSGWIHLYWKALPGKPHFVK